MIDDKRAVAAKGGRDLLAGYRERLKAEQERFEKAAKLVELLKDKAIQPESLEVVGYCAQATVRLCRGRPAQGAATEGEGVLEEALDWVLEALRAYPPVAVVDVSASGYRTTKPASALTEREAIGEVVPCFSLLVKEEGMPPRGFEVKNPVRAYWWSALGGATEGGLVIVEAELEAGVRERLMEGSYVASTRREGSRVLTVFHRKIAKAAEAPGAEDPSCLVRARECVEEILRSWSARRGFQNFEALPVRVREALQQKLSEKVGGVHLWGVREEDGAFKCRVQKAGSLPREGEFLDFKVKGTETMPRLCERLLKPAYVGSRQLWEAGA